MIEDFALTWLLDRETLEEWRRQNKKSGWFRIPIAQSSLIEVAAEAGFEFHHAEGRSAVVKKWLRPEEEDKVPPLASHQVGTAGFVVDELGRLLVIKERMHGTEAKWKLPGGMVDRGESFEQAACREVMEETGVRTNFESVLCLWHRHGLTWGTSDMYVVCCLAPTSTQIDIDPSEIADCMWMPMIDFLAHEDHPLITKVIQKLYCQGKVNQPIAEIHEDAVQWPGREPYPTYWPGIGL